MDDLGGTQMIGLLRRRLRGDRGTAALEFAIVLPVFLALVFGGITFGLAMSAKSVYSEAAADGARAAIGQTGSNVTATANAEAQNIVSQAGGIYNHSGTKVTSSLLTPCPNVGGSSVCVSVSVSGPPPINLGMGLPSSVSATYTVEVQ
jgi:Flp pilus assembly protein TadG